MNTENCNSSSSDDDSNSTDSNDETDFPNLSRKKRGIDWCATETEELPSSSNRSRPVIWPPTSSVTSSSSSNKVPWYGNFHTSQYDGTAKNWEQVQLFSNTNYFLAINADGTINGTRDKNDLHTKIKIINGGRLRPAGHVRIQGLLTNMYLALNAQGRPYAHYDVTDPNTEWAETPLQNGQVAYRHVLSVAGQRRPGGKRWYLGVKKSGKGKNGRKAKRGQKATMFLKIRPMERD